MAMSGQFSGVYSYKVYTPNWTESEGGACSCNVKWESSWQYGNTHTMTLTVQGVRTDGYSATLSGYVRIGDEPTIDLGAQNYPGSPEYQETFTPISFDIETDDYGNLISQIVVEVQFTRSSTEQHWARITSEGVVLEAPPKDVNIETPDGILCSVDKSTVHVGDQIVISITITGAQWEDATISVTGATQVSGMTYTVTGDVYIVVSGVLSGHTISITETGGISVTVYDEITGATYTDGSVVQHYSNITITYKLSTGYEFVSITVNGEAYDAGVSIEVSSDINIVARAKALGLAYIYTDSSFQPFQVYIYNGSEWRMCVPYVYDGTSWGLCV